MLEISTSSLLLLNHAKQGANGEWAKIILVAKLLNLRATK